jgi:hypothetical protein
MSDYMEVMKMLSLEMFEKEFDDLEIEEYETVYNEWFKMTNV